MKNTFEIIQSIFDHIHSLPQKDVEQSIVLVSYTEDHISAVKKITGLDSLHKQGKFPQVYKLKQKQNINLIDSTKSFLRPQVDINFITMRYIMRIVKKVKFIFVTDSSQTKSMPLQNMKQMITRFISLFKNLSSDLRQSLAASCGWMILNDENSSIQTYTDRLVGDSEQWKGLLQKDYIEDKYDDAKFIVKNIFDNQRVLLVQRKPKSDNCIKEQFCTFSNQLQYFSLYSQANPDVQNLSISSNVQFKLQSKYTDYVKQELCKNWYEYFELIYKNIDLLITKNNVNMEQILKQPGFWRNMRINQEKLLKPFGEQGLVEIIESYHNIRFDQKDKICPKYKRQEMRLLKLINHLFSMVMKMIKNQYSDSQKHNNQIVQQLLTALQYSGYITHPLIKYFTAHYFTIYRFLSDFTDDGTTDLFHRVSFFTIFRNNQTFNQKMRAIFVYLLEVFSEEINNDESYPYLQIIEELNKTLTYIQYPWFKFCTSRVIKKLIKFRAIIAYNYAKSLPKYSKKEVIKGWINFLKYSCKSQLLEDTYKIEGLSTLGNLLSNSSEFHGLALKLLDKVPQFLVYNKVIEIYEQKLHLDIDLLQYLDIQERKQIITKYLENYCQFLLKIGQQEKVRYICLECLRISNDQQEKEIIKRLYIMARGNDFRNLHNKFIETTIKQNKVIELAVQQLQQVEKELIKVKLI